MADASSKRAAIYARQSRTRGDTVSVADQVERCRAEAERRGYTVALVSDQDIDTSATKRRLKRPGLDLVRQAYPTLDAVFFFRLDRLARSVKDFATLAEEAAENRVALISATEPIDMSTAEGAALAGMLSIFAELEAKNTSARLRSTNEYLVRSGRIRGGKAPWWVTRVTEPETGIVTEHLNGNADTVRDWVARVLSGTPVYILARESGREQISILGMLRNPALAGYGVYHGRILLGDDGMPMMTRPPVIDTNTFRRLQDELDRRKEIPTERRGNLLSSMLNCAHCGGRLSSSGKHYMCHTKYKGGDCPGNSIRTYAIDEAVKADFLRRYGDWREVLDPPKRKDSDELDEARAAMSELMADRYEHGLFSGPEGRRQFAQMQARLEARISGLEQLDEPDEFVKGRQLRDFLPSADIDLWRKYLTDFVSAITVAKGTRGYFTTEERVSVAWSPDSADDIGELLQVVEAYPDEDDPWWEEARARMQARWESRPVKEGTLLEQYEAMQTAERGTGDTGDRD